jgi:hypothetical protein
VPGYPYANGDAGKGNGAETAALNCRVKLARLALTQPEQCSALGVQSKVCK